MTHGASAFAQVLLPALCAHPAVEAVTAIDAVAPRAAHPRLRTLPIDVRGEGVPALLAGHDAFVHLPPVPPALAQRSEPAEAAVRPAHKLFHAARAAGARRLVHVSTVAVYGGAIHAHEHSPLNPHPAFAYAREQAHLEQLLAIDFPECVRLRPHLIAGPHADPRLKRALRQPFRVRFPDPQPLFQCVHEDDLIEALLLCLTSEARGAHNIAAEDSFSLDDAIRSRHLVSMRLDPARAATALAFATRRLRWNLDPAWIEIAGSTLLVNCRRAATELGWRPRHTSRETLAAT